MIPMLQLPSHYGTKDNTPLVVVMMLLAIGLACVAVSC